MYLNEVKGNVFSSNTSLAHCISGDFRMSRGIAREFRARFGRIEELRETGATTGDVAVLRVGSIFVYNLITKAHYWQKPTYGTLRRSLEEMKEHAAMNHVTKISMPRIGCGLDRLMWSKVKALIKEVFQGLRIEITVYKCNDI